MLFSDGTGQSFTLYGPYFKDLSNTFSLPTRHILMLGQDPLLSLFDAPGRGLLPDPNPRVPRYSRVSGRVSG